VATFTLVLSKLVPLIFGLSGSLLLAKFSSESARRVVPRVAGFVFAGVLTIGMVAMIPFAARSWLHVRAFMAFEGRDWQRAVEYFDDYRRAGAGESTTTLRRHATSLVNLQRWDDAAALLSPKLSEAGGSGMRGPADLVELLAVCRYHLGDLQRAEEAFRGLRGYHWFEFRSDYYLGRIAELRFRFAEAVTWYRRSLDLQPGFFPALYQAVRLCVAQGRGPEAGDALDVFLRGSAQDSGGLGSAIRTGRPLPPREFFIVFP
jgi:tetratricopeptide (TPR) repeat protein